VPYIFRVPVALLDLQSVGPSAVLSLEMRIAKKDANDDVSLDVG